jgi:hypothetical protein
METKFIAPRCGIGNMTCHAVVFEPKGLDKPDMVQMLLVNQPSRTLCKSDKYIAKGDPMKSFVMAKITATGDKVTCPSGGDGGAKMPFMGGMPLTKDELDCFVWYINTMAMQ